MDFSTQATSPNPEKRIKAIVAAEMERNPQWDGSWIQWDAAKRAALIRAIVADHLDDNGHGRDWILAGHRAAFLMATLFHDRFPLPEAGAPLPFLEIRVLSPEEGFAVNLRRSSIGLLPPVSVPGGSVLANTAAQTTMAESAARAFMFMDATALPDRILADSLQQIGDQVQDYGRVSAMLLGAFIVRWRAVQENNLVRGGVVFRDIHHTDDPAGRRGDVRLTYERLGAHIEEAKSNTPDGGAFLLA